MMGNWKTCHLGDLITFQRGHDLPKTKMQGSTYPVIGSNGIIGYHDEYTTEAPSITIGRSGNVGKPFLYKGRSWSHNTSLYIREYKNVDPIFIYYFLQTLDLGNYAGGSAVPTLNRNHIHTLSVTIPIDVEEQHQIASVLSVLDDKLEKNRAINENLQEQAKTIFTKMIIEDADESWTPGVLSDIAIVTMGQSPKGDTYNEDGVGTVFFQGRAEFGFRFPTRRLSTTNPKRMAQANDALMSVRAPVGDMNVAYEDCCIGRGLAAIHSKDSHQSFVLYTMFDLREELNVFNCEGTVFGSINRDALNSMPISIPPKRVMDEFEATVAPIDAIIRNNYDEICRLEAIRDNLLPKLMSGELDVSMLEL